MGGWVGGWVGWGPAPDLPLPGFRRPEIVRTTRPAALPGNSWQGLRAARGPTASAHAPTTTAAARSSTACRRACPRRGMRMPTASASCSCCAQQYSLPTQRPAQAHTTAAAVAQLRALCTVCSALAGAALMQLPPMRCACTCMHGVLRGEMWRGHASKQAGGREGQQVGNGVASIMHHSPTRLATRYRVAWVCQYQACPA